MKRRHPPALALALLFGLLTTGCGQGQFANPFAVSLKVTATPATLELVAGEAKTVTVSASDGDATMTSFDVSTAAPKGLSVAGNGPVLTVTSTRETPAGLYPVAVNVTVPNGGGSSVLPVRVLPNPTPTYSAALTQTAATIVQGSDLVVSVIITRQSGYQRTPQVMRVSGGEALNASVQGNSVHLRPTLSTTPGTYALSVEVSDGDVDHHLALTVTVVRPQEKA
ncbi:hypothetical protein [Deinococcus multiflagellatus]|uniref:DUF4625 domain-containing protein n=1 Tax=Deinococcus multiflagellatus TaxID=1656887 RepID=A0ABW1ZVD2_9DEIO|nr:hypothetical protein [Deinococcus multiflagellatus]MBZ9714434.1 hypothetical protein [Deinococcus multiflagellatus]